MALIDRVVVPETWFFRDVQPFACVRDFIKQMPVGQNLRLLSIPCSTGEEAFSLGMVLLDLASRVQREFRVFTLDTEFLFPETYDLMDRVEKRYGIKVEKVLSTLTPEEQEREFGPALWSHDPDKCCGLRKVEPLKTKLAELRAWITAIRRDQTSARASARKADGPPDGGTLNYMSPERLRSGGATAEDDVYAMALTLWEMWTCSVPEPGDKPREKTMRSGPSRA